MPVVGIVLREMKGKRIADYNGVMNINSNSAIKDVEEIDLPAVGRRGIKVNFEFKTDYQTEKSNTFADIIITGDVLWLVEDASTIIKNWKKDKKLPEDISLQTINTILRKCATKALVLSEDLNLPPPIALPFATKREEAQQSQRYIG